MSFLPNLAGVLWSMTDLVQYAIIEKEVVDHQVVESNKDVRYFQGCFQPVPSRELKIKPEGQRSWNPGDLYTEVELEIDTVFQDPQRRQYRVMSIEDWSNSGYRKYTVVQGPRQP